MLPMSKRDKSALVSGGLRQMYEMVGYKLCLRFFTIQISEAKKKKKRCCTNNRNLFFTVQRLGSPRSRCWLTQLPSEGTLPGLQMANFQLSTHKSDRGGEESFLMSFLMGTSCIRREPHPHDLF